MQRGPRPRPTHLRLLQGNPSKRPINRNEPKPPVLATVPAPPAHLHSLDARAEWERLAPGLHVMGLLTEFDLMPLSAYCQAYARWLQAEKALLAMGAADMLTGALMIKTAKGSPIQNPLAHRCREAPRHQDHSIHRAIDHPERRRPGQTVAA